MIDRVVRQRTSRVKLALHPSINNCTGEEQERREKYIQDGSQ